MDGLEAGLLLHLEVREEGALRVDFTTLIAYM